MVLPLVLVMVLALVQIGLIAKDQLLVEEAARAGARQGAVTSDDSEVSRTAVDSAPSLDPQRIQVSVLREGGVGSPVRVTVLYRSPVVVPAVAWLFPSVIELTSTATMRQETS